MKTGDKGIRLIKYFEGYYARPYLCPRGYATVGYGHLVLDPESKEVLKGSDGLKKAKELYPFVSEEMAVSFLKEDVRAAEVEVNRLVKVPILQHQYDALVSHVFNCGVSDTLFKLINSVPFDSVEIKNWWLNTYITSGGKRLSGLVKRRLSEYILFTENRLNLM